MSGSTWKVGLTDDNDGFWALTCTCPEFAMTKPGWAPSCQHVVDVMKLHRDVDPQNQTILDPFVEVTVCRHPGILARVSLGDPDYSGIRSLMLMIPASDDSGWVQEFDLGFVHQNEGRHSLRQVILEWIVGAWGQKDDFSCSATHHASGGSPYERYSRELTANKLPNFALMADWFDLMTTGYCRRCNEDSGVPDTPF